MERSPEEVHAFITKINSDLHEFIAKTIRENDSINREWSHLFDEVKNPRCYEIMGCNNSKCPVRNGDDYRCWLQVGTLCGHRVQGDFAQKYGTCVKCEVYHQYHQEPIRALYENIDILISHLTGEVGEYRRRSITDRLTGAYNRNFFEEIISRELDKAARLRLYTSFIIIDLNSFKAINDSLGHLTGDDYLRETAQLLQANVRYSDVVFRMGGDEFLILLINSSKPQCETCGERIYRAVDLWNEDNAAKLGAPLSLSIGMDTLPPGERDYLASISRADAHMYSQKMLLKKQRLAE